MPDAVCEYSVSRQGGAAMKHGDQSQASDAVTSQAKKLAKRGPQAAEAGSKPEAGEEHEEAEQPHTDTAPAIALD